MSRRAQSIALPVLFLLGITACGSDNANSASPPEPDATDETETPVVAETEPETEPVATDAPDYPEREVKPEEEWASNYLFASEMGTETIGYYHPYEYHNVVDWSPDVQDEKTSLPTNINACDYDAVYSGRYFLDVPVQSAVGYTDASDDVFVNWSRDNSVDGSFYTIVSTPVSCEAWAQIVEEYNIDPYIAPHQVVVSENVAYDILDVDAVAERDILENQNGFDFRNPDQSSNVYYTLNPLPATG